MITSADINNDAVLEELTRLFADYEHALQTNDVATLQNFFWPSPLALRFGATEQLYGAKAIDEFRQNRVINFTDRTTLRQDLVAIGQNLGIATLEFSVKVAGVLKHGRQTQVWVRFAGLGWRIVSAHVSHKVDTTATTSPGPTRDYLLATAGLLGMPLDAAFVDEVNRNLDAMAAVAAPLMGLSLPDKEEAARELQP